MIKGEERRQLRLGIGEKLSMARKMGVRDLIQTFVALDLGLHTTLDHQKKQLHVCDGQCA